jgi:hypothetical protein
VVRPWASQVIALLKALRALFSSHQLVSISGHPPSVRYTKSKCLWRRCALGESVSIESGC